LQKKLLIWMVLLVCCFVNPFTANADVGPKPSITVNAENMPDDICYMDLLVEGLSGEPDVNSFSDQKYNKELVRRLKDYNVNGWSSITVSGKIFMFGDILCEIEDGKCTLDYGYRVPDEFKIIVVTKNGDTVVSNKIKRRAYNSTVYFDFKTGKATEEHLFIPYILQFLTTCSITIVIEGLVLLLFRFKLRENLKPFLSINIATQVLLSLLIFYGMYTKGILAALLMYILTEIFIFVFESVLFARFLKQHSKVRRVMFSLTANTVSFITGIIIAMRF